jgi:hypothetical protein
MKITTKTTTTVPLEKPAEFARAMTNTAFQVSVTTITTSSDLATFVRTLNGKTRPFAAAVVEGK